MAITTNAIDLLGYTMHYIWSSTCKELFRTTALGLGVDLGLQCQACDLLVTSVGQ